MGNFLLGTVLTAGAGLLTAATRRSRNIVNRQVVDRNKQETFNEPRSSYGDFISQVWGWGRVSGILVYNLLPPIEEVSVAITEETQNEGGKGGGGGSTTTVTEEQTYSYFGDVAWIISQEVSSDALKEIRLNGRLFWKDGTIDPKYASQGCEVRFYEGTSTQDKDELFDDLPEQINYRYRALLVIERLPLELFGNNYPQASIILKNGEPKLSEIIENICLESNYLTVDDIDTTDLEDIDVPGFQIDSQMTLLDKINRLAQIYLFDIISTGNKIKFQKQFRPSSVLNIPFADLKTATSEENAGNRYKQDYGEKDELPTQYEIKYLDRNNNLLPSIERSNVIREKNTNLVTIDFSGVLEADRARTIANTLLWLAWERSITQNFTLPLKYAVLEPGDVVNLEIGEVNEFVQIQKISISVSNILSISCWKYRARAFEFTYLSPATFRIEATATIGVPIPLNNEVYSVNEVSMEGTVLTEGIDYTVDLNNGTITPLATGSINNGDQLNIVTTGKTEPVDTPLFTPSVTDLKVKDIFRAYPNDPKGVYVFGDGGASWRNASVYASRDSEVSYQYVGALVTRSVFGTCDTVLGSHGDINLVDTVNLLEITLPSHAELSSISIEEFNRGENRALVGNEIVDFQNATLLGLDSQGNRQYRLDTFWRGLNCTYDQITGHLPGEEFYLLSGYKIIALGSVEDVGNTIYFKSVTLGQTLDDVIAVSLVIQGNGAKALSPIISGFSPTQGNVGTTVTIFGEGFSQATSVTFNGVEADSFIIDFDTQITAIVAAGTLTGKIVVSNIQSLGESVTNFVIGNVEWGEIGGTLSNQVDLQTALDNKATKREAITAGLTSDLQLTLSSAYYQCLTPLVQNRDVILPVAPINNPVTEFVIINVGNGVLSLNIKESVGGAIERSLNNTTKFRGIKVFYNGVEWISYIIGYYE